MSLRAVLRSLFARRAATDRFGPLGANRQRPVVAIRRWASSADAEARGMRLLEQNLSAAQAHQFSQSGSFEVVGSDTGKRYRINWLLPANIDELDAGGRRIRSWCFNPIGDLVMGDVLLAQKLALELFETEALSVANTIRDTTFPRRMPTRVGR